MNLDDFKINQQINCIAHLLCTSSGTGELKNMLAILYMGSYSKSTHNLLEGEKNQTSYYDG